MKQENKPCFPFEETADGTIFIWICNIGAERFWHNELSYVKDINEDSVVNRISEISILLAKTQDYVVTHEKPDDYYIKQMSKYGFKIPHFIYPGKANYSYNISELIINNPDLIEELIYVKNNNKNVYLLPYAVTDLEEQISRLTGIEILGSSAKLSKEINSKIFSRELAEKLGFLLSEGYICISVKEVEEAYHSLIRNGIQKVIIKEPFGASGKGLYLIDSEKKLLTYLQVLKRFHGDSNSQWIVEGWYEKLADINYQIYISQSSEVTIFSIKEQIVNHTVYLGSIIPPRIDENIRMQYDQFGLRIGKELARLGYHGVLGIDSIITDNCDIIPIIEINGRFTLSTYLSGITRLLPNACMISRYFRIKCKYEMSYFMLEAYLKNNNLLFDGNKGVLVYLSCTLPRKNVMGSDYNGRIFTCTIADTYEISLLINSKLEACLNDLNNGLDLQIKYNEGECLYE